MPAGFPVTDLEFVDATRLLAAAGDGSIVVWDLAHGTRDATPAHRPTLHALVKPHVRRVK